MARLSFAAYKGGDIGARIKEKVQKCIAEELIQLKPGETQGIRLNRRQEPHRKKPLILCRNQKVP